MAHLQYRQPGDAHVQSLQSGVVWEKSREGILCDKYIISKFKFCVPVHNTIKPVMFLAVAKSVSWSVQTEISQHLLDGLTFIVSQTFVIPWLFMLHHHEIDICSFERSISTTIGWISMKLLQIFIPLKMYCNIRQSHYPLTFYLSPSSGYDLNLSSTLVYDQIHDD